MDGFCRKLGLGRGVSGYIYHTVPVAVYAFLLHGDDFKGAMSAILSCGGDTDTSGAILGAMLGARGQKIRIPKEWVDGVRDWPRSIRLMEDLARQLNSANLKEPAEPIQYFVPAVLLRNIVFLSVVLLHGFARLLPSFCFRRMFPR